MESPPSAPGPSAQGFPTSIGGPAAIDRQRYSVHETGSLLVSEDSYRSRLVGGPCKARHRYAIDDVLIRVRAAALVRDVHLRLDPARADCIDTHTSSAPFRGKRFRKSDQAMLGCIVCTAMADTGEPGYRGDVDDASAPPL